MICTVLCHRLKGGGVEGVRWKRNSSSGQLHKWLANEMVMFMTPVFKKKRKEKKPVPLEVRVRRRGHTCNRRSTYATKQPLMHRG